MVSMVFDRWCMVVFQISGGCWMRSAAVVASRTQVWGAVPSSGWPWSQRNTHFVHPGPGPLHRPSDPKTVRNQVLPRGRGNTRPHHKPISDPLPRRQHLGTINPHKRRHAPPTPQPRLPPTTRATPTGFNTDHALHSDTEETPAHQRQHHGRRTCATTNPHSQRPRVTNSENSHPLQAPDQNHPRRHRRPEATHGRTRTRTHGHHT